MSRKIGKILRDAFYIRQKGLATIPLMIALLLMAVAIPVVTLLVQQQQDIRNRAAYETGGGGAGVDPCEICNASCSEGKTCFVGAENCCTHTTVGGGTHNCGCLANTCPDSHCFDGSFDCGAGTRDCSARCSCADNLCNTQACIWINPTTGDSESCTGKRDCSGECVAPNCTLCAGAPCKAPNTCQKFGNYDVCREPVDCSCAATTCVGQTCNGGKCAGTKADCGVKCGTTTCPSGDYTCGTNPNTCCSKTDCFCICGSNASCLATCSGNIPTVPTVVNHVCTPGELQCMDPGIGICKSDGSGWITSRCGEFMTCNSTTKKCEYDKFHCGPENAGQKSCGNKGSTVGVITCRDNGDWLMTESCGRDEYCKVIGGNPTCVSKYETCGAEGGGGFCTKRCDTSPGHTVSVVEGGTCQGGFTCCKNNDLGQCPPVLGGSGSCMAEDKCKSGQTVGDCPGGGDWLCCTGESYECLPDDSVCAGGIAKTCVDNKWKETTCPSGQCNGSVCLAVCGSGDTKCDGNNLITCSDGNWSTGGTDCGVNGCSETGGKAHCNECRPGETTCNGNQLLTCGVVTGEWNGTDCGTEGCYTTEGGSHCGQFENCTPGEKICVDGKLSTCNEAGTEFVGETPCIYGCATDGKKCNPAPTPTTGGGTNTPTGPVACDCRHNPAAKAIGDANCDGVDIYDASIWRSEFADQNGSTVRSDNWKADFNCDGYVNMDDLNNNWLPNYIKKLVPAK